jgi:hypothetical protein
MRMVASLPAGAIGVGRAGVLLREKRTSWANIEQFRKVVHFEIYERSFEGLDAPTLSSGSGRGKALARARRCRTAASEHGRHHGHGEREVTVPWCWR